MKIQPEKQFPHSTAIVHALAEQYSIDVTGYQEASSGIENTTLIINSTDNKYVFRIYRQEKKTTEQIQAEIEFMAYLRQGGIPVPRIIPNNRKHLITLFATSGKAWQVIAMECIDGEHREKPPAELLSDIASTQARMHLLATKYPLPTDNIRVIQTLVETEFIQQIDQSSLDPDLEGFLQRGAHFKLTLSDTLPTGPCHADYNERNILCKDNSIAAVLDFDDLSVMPYVVCLAYTLWHVHNQLGEAALQGYLEQYEQLRPLTSPEKQMLYSIILFRHYVITALKVLDGQTSHQDIQNYLQTERYLMASQAGNQ